MDVLETERLNLRWLNAGDAPFILELLNDPDWLRYIGDRGVQTLDHARAYIADGPVTMYERHGFGLNAVELKGVETPIGICGMLKRDLLDEPDLGFAFLPAYRGRGYALEAATAVLGHARGVLGLGRIVAVVAPDNEKSAKLLRKLGMDLDRSIRLEAEAEAVDLFTIPG